MTTPTVALVVVAAGSGTRLGADVPKALVALAGRPLLDWVLQRLAGQADELVVVAPPAHVSMVRSLVDAGPRPGLVVPGGASRTASVAAGLAATSADSDLIAVHDAARPLVDARALRSCVAALADGRAAAAAPALPVTDTLKRVAEDEPSRVLETLDRRTLRAVQTPQVFRREWLRRAHASGREATDDLALVEDLGGVVRLVPGSAAYLKVTFPPDLLLAEALVAAESTATTG